MFQQVLVQADIRRNYLAQNGREKDEQRKQSQQKVERQLRGSAEHVVLVDFMPDTPAQFRNA
jgi:hypothetical protein